MMKNPICPHCGNKDTAEQEGHYHCSGCGADFGAPALDEDGRPLADAIQGLRFRYGDVMSGSVRLRFIEDADHDACLYEVYDSSEGGLNKHAGTITLEEWNLLKHKMYDHLFLQDWDHRYLHANDGSAADENNEWELVMQLPGTEEYTFEGVDAYPVYWGQLMKLFEPYFHELEQH